MWYFAWTKGTSCIVQGGFHIIHFTLRKILLSLRSDSLKNNKLDLDIIQEFLMFGRENLIGTNRLDIEAGIPASDR